MFCYIKMMKKYKVLIDEDLEVEIVILKCWLIIGYVYKNFGNF